MKLWKTRALGSTAAVLVGLSAVSPAMAAPDAKATAAAVASAASLASGSADASAIATAASLAQELSTPGPRAAQPLSLPGYDLVQVEDRTVSYRLVEEFETQAPVRSFRFANDGGAPSAVYVEIHYRAASGEFVKVVSPLVQPYGEPWYGDIPVDAQDVDLQLHDASGTIVAERSYPGAAPSGSPRVFWEKKSYFDLPGYTFVW